MLVTDKPLVTSELATTPAERYIIKLDRALSTIQRIDIPEAAYRGFCELFNSRYEIDISKK